MKKLLIVISLTTAYLSSDLFAANEWIYGEVASVELNSTEETIVIRVLEKGASSSIPFVLREDCWSESMKKYALSLVLTAKSTGKEIRFWGDKTAGTIKTKLRIQY